jgi:hypothetical protein
MATEPELPHLDADDADVLEQRQSVDPGDVDDPTPLHLDTSDADEADLLEQQQAVPLDDEDWPT